MLSNYKECVPMQKSYGFFYEVNLPLTYRWYDSHIHMTFTQVDVENAFEKCTILC